MLSFIIRLAAGAVLGCIAGFMVCSILAAGRIRDAERAVELAERRINQR